jgi:hypothetical protein
LTARRFLFKKQSICKFSPLKRFLLSVCIRPAVENSLSDDTEEAL